MDALYPIIRLKKGKDEALRRRHPWVFSGAILEAATGLQAGDTVSVCGSNGDILGTGFCEPDSIAVKMLCFENRRIDQAFFLEKFQTAFALRQRLGLTEGLSCGLPTGFPESVNPSLSEPDKLTSRLPAVHSGKQPTDCYRLVHSEGDGLPGLIVDIYGKTAVVQAQTEGMVLHLDLICAALLQVQGLFLDAVYSKSEEALKRMGKAFADQHDHYLYVRDASFRPCPQKVWENGASYLVDWEKGQKTGFFLDQRDNRDLVRQLAAGRRVLNAFSYTGGFSVSALRGGAAQVTTVDCSKKAIDAAAENLRINGFDPEKHPCTVADMKDYWRSVTPGQFDLIILDPPAFVKNRHNLHNGLLGYHYINLEALKNIASGGLLFTFSCSQAVDKSLFQSMLTSAAIESGREIQILYQLSQPADHPVNIYHPEGSYLKGLVVRVV